jgi:CBS-domain-containing membrane protein
MLFELVVAADLMRTGATPLRPHDGLDAALELFVESDLLALPVIESDGQGRVIGIVKRADVSGTYLRYVQGMNETADGTAYLAGNKPSHAAPLCLVANPSYRV